MEIKAHEFEAIKDFVWDRLSKTSISYFEWVGEDGDSNDYADNSLNEARYDMGARSFDYGCTKSVFFFDELDDYVVKIPFMGECWDEYSYDDDDDDEYETQYDGYTCGGCRRNWDYCEVEAELYQEAIQAGVEDLLCGTWFLGLYDGYPIYISEKAKSTYNYKSHESFNYNRPSYSKAMANSIAEHDYNYFGKNILSMMIDAQGVRKVNKLMHFVQDFDISDFHNGNFMFAKDGSLRLIDYSSFHH